MRKYPLRGRPSTYEGSKVFALARIEGDRAIGIVHTEDRPTSDFNVQVRKNRFMVSHSYGLKHVFDVDVFEDVPG